MVCRSTRRALDDTRAAAALHRVFLSLVVVRDNIMHYTLPLQLLTGGASRHPHTHTHTQVHTLTLTPTTATFLYIHLFFV